MKKETPTVTISRCSVQELPQLRDLAIRTFQATYAAQNTAEVMADYLRRAFNEQQLRQELTHPESEFYLLKSEAEWLGYMKLNEGSAQTEEREDQALEVERIYVDAGFHGLGLGKMMIQKALEVARSKNKERLWLGVWEHNPKAIQFYERQGFKKNGTHTFYIGGEAQVDWVMETEV